MSRMFSFADCVILLHSVASLWYWWIMLHFRSGYLFQHSTRNMIRLNEFPGTWESKTLRDSFLEGCPCRNDLYKGDQRGYDIHKHNNWGQGSCHRWDNKNCTLSLVFRWWWEEKEFNLWNSRYFVWYVFSRFTLFWPDFWGIFVHS